MTDVERRTIAFFARWSVSHAELLASFTDVLAPDCRWEQKPMAVTRTRAGALRFLRLSHRVLGLETIEVELPHVAAVGNVVLTERVDHLLRRDGTVIASAPVAGVLEFDAGGRIVRWREHFDAVSFAAQMPARALRRRPLRTDGARTSA